MASAAVKIFRPWACPTTNGSIAGSRAESKLIEDDSSNSDTTSDHHPLQTDYLYESSLCSGLYGLPQMFEDWSDSVFLAPSILDSQHPSSLSSYFSLYAFPEFAASAGTGTSAKLSKRPKKFSCPHCKVSFSNNGQLKGHVRIHTGERPFKCDQEKCGKSFTRNEELTRHKRIHTGLRPYPCQHCGKPFGRKDHLKKHIKTHFPQPRYIDHPILSTASVAAAHYLSTIYNPLVYGLPGSI